MKKQIIAVLLSVSLFSALQANCEASGTTSKAISTSNKPFDFSGFKYGLNNLNTIKIDNNKINEPLEIIIHTLKGSSLNKNILNSIFSKLYKDVKITFNFDKEIEKPGRLYPFLELKTKTFPDNLNLILSLDNNDNIILTNDILRAYFNIKDKYYQNEAYTYKNLKYVKDNLFSLYVMSLCPFGIKSEEMIIDKIKNGNLDPEKIDIHYIVSKNKFGFSSLHGENELNEDSRQLYIKDKLGKKVLWTYISKLFEYKGDYNKALKDINLSDEIIFKDMNYISKLLTIESIYTQKNNINSSPTYVSRDGSKIEQPLQILSK